MAAGKTFKSSKATMHHIKHVVGDLQATQINLMRHQRTELPTNRHNKKRRPTGKQKPYKTPECQATNQVKNLTIIEKYMRHQIAVINVVIPFTHKDFNALQRSINVKYVTNTVTFQVYAIKGRLKCTTRTAAETPKYITFKQD